MTEIRKSALTVLLMLIFICCFMAASAEESSAASVNTPQISGISSNFAGELTVEAPLDSNVSGYRITYSKSKNFSNAKKKYVTGKTLNKTIANLTNGSKYYVKVQAYKKLNGKKVYSAYSAPKSVTVKTAHTAYITQQETKLKYSKSGSKGKIVPYMTPITIVKSTKSTKKGTQYRVKYKKKTYYLWVASGASKFTNKKSAYSYSGENSLQNSVLKEAMRIYNRGNTYYARSSKVKTGKLTSKGYAFDCSGLVKYIYGNSMGYQLPATASKIYRATKIDGKTVKKVCSGKWDNTKVKPGDILCFDENDSGKCTHVGIYLGNNEFIHAVKKYGVTISPMNGCWYDYFKAAKRVS